MERGSDATATKPPAEINPIVRAERRMTHSQLRAAVGGKTGEDHLAEIGAVIGIGILKIKNVRGASDNQTATPREQTVGKIQSVNEVVALGWLALRHIEHGDSTFSWF